MENPYEIHEIPFCRAVACRLKVEIDGTPTALASTDMRLADALKLTADAQATADPTKADAAAALAEIQALKPEMMAEKMAKHHTDAIGDLSEAEYGARKAGYWGLRVTMESHLARCAVGFSQRRKARCLLRGAAPSMAFRIGLPITSASTRRRSSETPGFFRPTDVALPLPFRIWTFALAGARSFCDALSLLAAGGPLAIQGLRPLFPPISGASPLVALG